MVALAAAAAVVWTGCAHRPMRRPAAVTMACGDGNLYATTLHWRSWGTRAAVATGVGHVNDCTPNCAAGHFHTFAVTIRLSHPVTCVAGRREFARVAWTGPRAGAETLPCSFLELHP